MSAAQIAQAKFGHKPRFANGTARLRMGETVYPVNIRRVLDASELDAAWTARLAKDQTRAISGDHITGGHFI